MPGAAVIIGWVVIFGLPTTAEQGMDLSCGESSNFAALVMVVCLSAGEWPMPMQSASDAGFFSLVHEVLEAEKNRSVADRRDGDRQAYHCVQLIAPYHAGRLPAAAEFRHVQCQDLSPGGMSYFDHQPPEHSQLLVLLGTPPFTILTAEVAHQQPVTVDGRTECLIGCRFIGRLNQK
jgi:hypothetical protein